MERQPALPLIAEPAGQNQAPELRAASAIPLVPGRSAPPPVEARPCATSGLGPFHVSAIVATQQRSLRPSSTAIWRRIESERSEERRVGKECRSRWSA